MSEDAALTLRGLTDVIQSEREDVRVFDDARRRVLAYLFETYGVTRLNEVASAMINHPTLFHQDEIFWALESIRPDKQDQLAGVACAFASILASHGDNEEVVVQRHSFYCDLFYSLAFYSMCSKYDAACELVAQMFGPEKLDAFAIRLEQETTALELAWAKRQEAE